MKRSRSQGALDGQPRLRGDVAEKGTKKMMRYSFWFTKIAKRLTLRRGAQSRAREAKSLQIEHLNSSENVVQNKRI